MRYECKEEGYEEGIKRNLQKKEGKSIEEEKNIEKEIQEREN